LEQSENCGKDYLEVREAYFKDPNDPSDIRGEYGAILAKPMCGSTKPSSIQSTGNMVWVQFKSDRNTTTTYKGFKASFTAGTYTSDITVVTVQLVKPSAQHILLVFLWALLYLNAGR